MSLCFAIHCPGCGEPMTRGVDWKSLMITIYCRKCDKYAGIEKPEATLSLHALGMSFSTRDVESMLQIFTESL